MLLDPVGMFVCLLSKLAYFIGQRGIDNTYECGENACNNGDCLTHMSLISQIGIYHYLWDFTDTQDVI